MVTRMHLSSLGESTRVLQGFEQSFNSIDQADTSPDLFRAKPGLTLVIRPTSLLAAVNGGTGRERAGYLLAGCGHCQTAMS
jgi:hypothetical protein